VKANGEFSEPYRDDLCQKHKQNITSFIKLNLVGCVRQHLVPSGLGTKASDVLKRRGHFTKPTGCGWTRGSPKRAKSHGCCSL